MPTITPADNYRTVRIAFAPLDNLLVLPNYLFVNHDQSDTRSKPTEPASSLAGLLAAFCPYCRHGAGQSGSASTSSKASCSSSGIGNSRSQSEGCTTIKMHICNSSKTRKAATTSLGKVQKDHKRRHCRFQGDNVGCNEYCRRSEYSESR